jgi:hypothetical protein
VHSHTLRKDFIFQSCFGRQDNAKRNTEALNLNMFNGEHGTHKIRTELTMVILNYNKVTIFYTVHQSGALNKYMTIATETHTWMIFSYLS